MLEKDISLFGYPIESVFAEKLHALVSHGKANSRMKDYHDMLVMVRDKAVEKSELKKSHSDNVWSTRSEVYKSY